MDDCNSLNRANVKIEMRKKHFNSRHQPLAVGLSTDSHIFAYDVLSISYTNAADAGGTVQGKNLHYKRIL